jgi:Questin oxidase-like
LLDNPPPIPSPYKTTDLAEVINRVQNDERFKGIVEMPGTVNFGIVLQSRFEAFMEHWNAWEIKDPIQQLEHCCDLSVLLAISAGYGDGKYDFFYAHIMTVAHAVRVLYHYFPADRRASILRQYGFFTILLYILQKRLPFGIEEIESVETNSRDWNWVTENTLKHRWALDDHFFKVVRATKAFAETYGEKNGFYLRAAIKYVTEFNGWEGFGEGVMGFLPSRDGYIPA